VRCIERMHFNTTNFQARAPASRYFHVLIVGAARRGMSDVGGSLLCIWHCAVDNISINCGYAKGMRRSLIRGYSFLQLKRQYGADVTSAGEWKRATPAWRGRGARARTRVETRESRHARVHGRATPAPRRRIVDRNGPPAAGRGAGITRSRDRTAREARSTRSAPEATRSAPEASYSHCSLRVIRRHVMVLGALRARPHALRTRTPASQPRGGARAALCALSLPGKPA
jgi:hypothetical protein